jgi:hypothetical protein
MSDFFAYMLGIGAGDFVGVPSSEHGEFGTGLRGANDDEHCDAIFSLFSQLSARKPEETVVSKKPSQKMAELVESELVESLRNENAVRF